MFYVTHDQKLEAMKRRARKTRARNRRARTLRIFGIGMLSGVALFGTAYVALHNSPTTTQTVASQSSRIYEDDPRWDCTTMGDRICGPGNSNGVPAGIYDSGGVLVLDWATYTGKG